MASSETPPPYVAPGENPITRTEGDNVPDDFKYSDIVAECDVEIRLRFLQRVYLLLSAQLLTTTLISGAIISLPSVQTWALNNIWSMWVSIIGLFGFTLGTVLMRRQYPWNLTFMTLFTLCESYLIGIATSTLDMRILLNAFVITIVVLVGLSLFAMQTKYDFTSWQPYAGALLWALVGFGFVAMFTNSSGMGLAYSFIAVILFSVFILVDTQTIMYRFHPEDEIVAAIELYFDTINLFLNILRILNNTQDTNN